MLQQELHSLVGQFYLRRYIIPFHPGEMSEDTYLHWVQ